jgi:hypothetical protein
VTDAGKVGFGEEQQRLPRLICICTVAPGTDAPSSLHGYSVYTESRYSSYFHSTFNDIAL